MPFIKGWSVVSNASGHSRSFVMIIHQRQHRFFRYMSKAATMLLISPNKWGEQVLERSLVDGNFLHFTYPLDDYLMGFHHEALNAVANFAPDIILVQQEYYTEIARQFFMLAKELKCKLIFFCWENIYGRYNMQERTMIAKTDYVICGSREAEEQINPFNKNTEVMPQVGVDTERFAPLVNAEKEYDLIFVGREAENKGSQIIQKGVLEKTNFKLLEVRGTPYEQMPLMYNKAKVLVQPVLDTPYWKDQWLSFAVAEALACGLRAVGSSTRAYVEQGSDIPYFYIARMGSPEALNRGVTDALSDWKTNLEGRQYIIDHYSYEVMAKRLMGVFEKVLRKV